MDEHRVKPTPAWLALQMLTPRRAPSGVGLWIEDAQRHSFVAGGERVSVLQVGEAPFVLFVHGLGGAAVDFKALLPAVLSAGFGALLLDLPAHGESSGTLLTIPSAASAVRECGRRFGPLHAAIAHSLGSAALGEALRDGMTLDRAVLLAPPRRFLDGVDAAARAHDYNEDERWALLAELRKLGVDAPALDLPRAVAALEIPALIAHSEDDPIIPLAAGLAVAAAWSGSHFLRLSGLGHRRILRDAAVVEAVLRFVIEGRRNAASSNLAPASTLSESDWTATAMVQGASRHA